jgi:hypothetical protein
VDLQAAAYRIASCAARASAGVMALMALVTRSHREVAVFSGSASVGFGLFWSFSPEAYNVALVTCRGS